MVGALSPKKEKISEGMRQRELNFPIPPRGGKDSGSQGKIGDAKTKTEEIKRSGEKDGFSI